MLTYLIIFVVTVAILAILAKLYTVVDPNEAHIVVFMGHGRKVYTPHIDTDEQGQEVRHPTSYLFIPILMKRVILPLTNIKMEIAGFDLRDKSVAPFICEVACWLRINQPEVAVEKLEIGQNFRESVRQTLEEQVQGIARATAMNQEILDIMRNRKEFGNNVQREVNGALDEWGLQLAQLEITDFADAEGSNVIADYERKRKAEVEAESRKVVAQQNKDAEVVEAESVQVSGIAKAKSDREVQVANIEKEKVTKIEAQKAVMDIAKAEELANQQKVSAKRTFDVGSADVVKQATITEAEGQADAKFKVGKADADVLAAQGNAEAEVIRNKGLSEATAKDKMAEALAKYNEAATTIEKIKAQVEIEKVKYQAIGQALEKADLKVNTITGNGEGGSLFGIPMDANTGANLAQLVDAFEKVGGQRVADVAKNLGNKVRSAVKGNPTDKK